MGFGWAAPWPIQFGGGPTPVESAYAALKAGVGKGHASDIDGPEWRWREARAIGIAIAMTMAERAIMQFVPSTATSAVVFYAELFQLFGLSDQTVRTRAQQLQNDTSDSGTESLQDKLRAIDPNFSIIEVPYSSSVAAVHGAAFAGSSLPFGFLGSALESAFPNYSDGFVVTVSYDGGPPLLDAQSRAVNAAAALLNDELPAWVDFNIGAGSGGFILDSSHLDWDRFNP